MTDREKRKRRKQSKQMRRQLMVAASQVPETERARPFKHRYFDGTLTHDVTKDKRTFQTRPGVTMEYTTRDVFATKCGRVVAIDLPDYAFSKKPTNCIMCAAPKPAPLNWLKEWLHGQ